MTRGDRIEELCSKRYPSTPVTNPLDAQPIRIGPESLGLLDNGIRFHELEHDEILVACAGLAKALQPGRNSFTFKDQRSLWAWCHDLFLLTRQGAQPETDGEFDRLLKSCLIAPFAHPYESDFQSPNGQFLQEASALLPYFSLPLLEATVRRCCSEVVDAAGVVKGDFKVTQPKGDIKGYYPAAAGAKPRIINSVRDLLWYHRNKQDHRDKFKRQLNSIYQHLECLDHSQEAEDLLYQWRNSTLHGNERFGTIGGFTLNLSLLLLLEEKRYSYISLRDQLIKQSPSRPGVAPWPYIYPAYNPPHKKPGLTLV